MSNEQKLREALQAVIAAHEAGMRELGELMRTSGQMTLTVRGQAAVDTLDAIEKARAALALPTAAPVDERYEVDHQVATGGGKSSPLFVVRDKTTQLAEDVFADEHPVLYGLLQARAALQSSVDVRDAVLAEREACAKVCAALEHGTLAAQEGAANALENVMLRQVASLGHAQCASAIRARGEAV